MPTKEEMRKEKEEATKRTAEPISGPTASPYLKRRRSSPASCGA